MQGDDPPYLSVGTAVSAKYKGAFCEAKVSNVVRTVKCKITYKMGLGNATVTDEHIKGTLRVGQLVQVRHPEKKEFLDATITKVQDCSQYTVVFDDGDITTLRRTALCLKSGRHFNESETLDQLPLTHPEHFGNPVVGGRRGRRTRQPKEDSSDEEVEEGNEPDLELYSANIGRIVSVEETDKKKGKDAWFPGLIVMPSTQTNVKINIKDEFLVRSFKDGRYYTVPKKEASEFTREMGTKADNTPMAEAVERVLKYLDNDELPEHWEKNSLFNIQMQSSDSEDNLSDSSNDGSYEEKDRFVAQLYKFMDESGTPLNSSPTIGNQDVDLYKLFKMVEKLGGYNRVTNKNKWRFLATKLKCSNAQSHSSQVKSVYKKCLLSYETFYRTLGVTMLNHTRTTKKNKGRSLIRDKDRITPMNSPRPEKDDSDVAEKREDERAVEERPKTRKNEIKLKEEEKKKKELAEISDTCSSDTTDHSEPTSSTSKEIVRTKRATESKFMRDRKVRAASGEKVKAIVEKFEEQAKKEEKEEEKGQQTRSKSSLMSRAKEVVSPVVKREVKTPVLDPVVKLSSTKLPVKKEEEKKRGRKRIVSEEKTSQSDSSATESTSTAAAVNIGDKLKVYYGPTHESKVTYEAKVIEIDRDANGHIYLVHYTGWNTRYDEWIQPLRIAENLSAATKAKRLKQSSAITAKGTTPKSVGKRGRGTSLTGRSSVPDAPRSTTPSSVTSSSSRTKSPATPATRSAARIARQGETSRRTRRMSVQTDASMHSESDSEESESETEPELMRTRSGGKSEEGEIRSFRKKKTLAGKTEKRKDKEDDDTEKEDDVEKPRQLRKLRKSPVSKQATEDSDEDSGNPPKGRDFDLNQIRSELKGFGKVVKLTSSETSEKEALSSDDSNIQLEVKQEIENVEIKKEITEDKLSSSEDIYEFKEPEPFEFESCSKMAEDKNVKKRLVPRIFEEIEKSPKKKGGKSDVKEIVEPEKKRFKRTSIKEEEEEKKTEDPFDKLVESPSFQIIKSSEKLLPEKPKVARTPTLEESLGLFKDIEDSVEDDCGEAPDISDNEESQNHPLFSHGEDIFSEATFANASEYNLDDCVGFKSDQKKDSDDEDAIRASIQRVIAQTALTDEDSNEPLMFSLSPRKKDELKFSGEFGENSKLEVEGKTSLAETAAKQISPALQETDSALLESICAQPELLTAKIDDINVKTGTKIADSILQKFSMIKSKVDVKPGASEKEAKTEIKAEVKAETSKEEEKKSVPESKTKPKMEPKQKGSAKSLDRVKSAVEEVKKRSRKIMSREFIESDSDSSDSEQLVIAPSDDDSQTIMSFSKPDLKESDSNISLIQPLTTDESQSQDNEFRFNDIKISDLSVPETSTDTKLEPPESSKEDEPDSQLHSMLLCEETIPGSPSSAVEGPSEVESRPNKSKALHEMPFASAPGSSNVKSSVKGLITAAGEGSKEKAQQVPFVVPMESRSGHEASAVLDNTPPTTPESTISNLSPRGENGGLSPNTADNESCKSETECDYSAQRNASNKMSPYSEEDTLLNSELSRKEPMAAACKKRRRSCKTSEEVPVKRGRKPVNRSRHNSDSDDTSEHSVPGGTLISSSSFERLNRSPRPSKYNFFVELDPGLDSEQRIAVLQQKLTDLRKTYADVKAELATIERRRKKIRRREREALKAAKQEVTCT